MPTPCLPPSVPYAPQNLTPRRYDPTKARALLEQAGWQQLEGQPWRQKAGQPLAIELAFIGTDALAKSMAEIIQANLRQVGVQVTLVGEEESSIYARQREGRFGMIFNRTWGAPYDPHAFFKLDARPVACGLPGPARPARQGTD
ncbi:ABC transporter substrate-binding protein [Klebsiella pneumoniae subsp. pneumoniae]|nr:ABC transporter substrate-binding protein [Klebsiella pneumoniae subsp. pneumoniae]